MSRLCWLPEQTRMPATRWKAETEWVDLIIWMGGTTAIIVR